MKFRLQTFRLHLKLKECNILFTMTYRSCIWLMALFMVQGCIGGLGLDIKDHLIGIYYLTAPDDEKQCMLTFHEPSDGSTYSGIVSQTVFAVGYNEKYIIVKQHPDDNRKITNYFIVPVEQHITRENLKNVLGPLTYDQFLIKRNELAIPDSLLFTKEYVNLK